MEQSPPLPLPDQAPGGPDGYAPAAAQPPRDENAVPSEDMGAGAADDNSRVSRRGHENGFAG